MRTTRPNLAAYVSLAVLLAYQIWISVGAHS
jgi:hypothetical protein